MTGFKQASMKVIALALLSLGASALAAVQPVTRLPLTQDAGLRWHLPAGSTAARSASINRCRLSVSRARCSRARGRATA